MIYEMGSRGLKPISTHRNDARNNLAIGTVLQLNGYENPQYAVLKNMGIHNGFADYGASYMVANLKTFKQIYKNAYELKHISEKKDGRIQTYILSERLGENEIIELWNKSEHKRKEDIHKKQEAEAIKKAKEMRGRDLFKKHIPDDAKALIVGEYHENQSDIQSDYFAHKTAKTVILGYSKHNRDLFSEMRKHALKFGETKHLGLNMGHFEARVIIGEDFQENGSYYRKGQYSPWHRQVTEENGHIRVFKTHLEAEQWIKQQKPLEPVHFDGKPISFEWSIDEEKIEYRQKYSMGAGYFLKDGGTHSTGWSVRKVEKWDGVWSAHLYISLAENCIF